MYSNGDEEICTACSTLEKLSDAVSRMTVIPINSISYTIATNFNRQENCRFGKTENSEHILGIKLRTLTIWMRDFRFRCDSQYVIVIARLLRQNSNTLVSLTFSGISPVLEEL